jgi:hypothetical protein
MNMKILTKEDKQYLGRICRYMASMGMDRGEIDVDVDSGYFHSDSIDLSNIRHFSNNYSADIPEGLYPILEKIVNHSSDVWNNDIDDVDYSTFNIYIDCAKNSITSYQVYTTTEPNDSTENSWDESDIEEDDSLKAAFDSLDEVSDGKNEIEVTYEGNGDSGYIEDTMSNGESCPADVQDWCYSELENLHGGWEINEGSRGSFYFRLSPREVTLNHTYYIQNHHSDTLWEEKF